MEAYESVGSDLAQHLFNLGIKCRVNPTDTFMYIYIGNDDDKLKCPLIFNGFKCIIRKVDPKRLPK